VSAAATCPNGHPSDEADYCSVCGAPIGGGADPPGGRGPAAAPSGASLAGGPPAGGAPGSGAATGTCPSCGTPRTEADARYCEVCRYDFASGSPGPPPVAPAPEVAPAGAVEAPAGVGSWEVTLAVDPSLDVDPDPDSPAPADAPDRVFAVDLPEMLVGRRDDRRDIRPDIPVLDPAVSRRHAKLVRQAGGGLAVLDLASANGTAVNGVELPAGEPRPLEDGDRITMGRWTRITIHRRP
jgi:hypothetical protein